MKKALIIFIFLLLLPSSIAAVPEDYLTEFNESGEVCSDVDYFYYTDIQPFFLDFNKNVDTIPVFYSCCSETSCTTIIFDVLNQKFLSDFELQELIDLNYVKGSLAQGKITTSEFGEQGFNLCKPFNTKKIARETVNVVNGIAENLDKISDAKHVKTIAECAEIARALKITNPVSWADLGLSVVCTIEHRTLKKAVEKLSACNLYLNSISQNKAQTGYISSLNTCNTEAKIILENYLDSEGRKIKNTVEKSINTVTGYANLFYEELKDPSERHELKIASTEYDMAKSIYSELTKKQLFFGHPERTQIFNAHKTRIQSKSTEAEQNMVRTTLNLDNIKKVNPNLIERFFKNLFFEPNLNLSEANVQINAAKGLMKNCQKLKKEYKYNSVIECSKTATSQLISAKIIIDREQKVDRKLDSRWILYPMYLLIIIVALFITVKMILNKKKENQQ